MTAELVHFIKSSEQNGWFFAECQVCGVEITRYASVTKAERDEYVRSHLESKHGGAQSFKALGEIEVDRVNHPSHYNYGKIECIEFIEDQSLGFHLGNAVKYVTRAGKKDSAKTIEDLEKAVWYIRRHIETLKPESDRRRPNEMPQERN